MAWPQFGGRDFFFLILSEPFQLSSVQSLSCVRLFVTPWTAARKASLSITNFWSLLKLLSIERTIYSHFIPLCALRLEEAA